MTTPSEQWGIIMEKFRALEYEMLESAEKFERIRIANIAKRYDLLLKALDLPYAKSYTARRIADLGAELEAHKAYSYTGNSPFEEVK